MFGHGLESLVVEPCKYASAFDATYNRMRRCVAVLGHERADKTGFLTAYCEKQSIGYYVFEFDPTLSVSQSLATFQDALRKKYAPPKEDKSNNVLILARADRMAFECDTLEAATFVTNLEAMAETLRAIVVCLIDRTPMQVRDCSPKHVQRFFSQFTDALLYYEPPTTAYIGRYLRHHFKEFQALYYSTLRQHTSHKRELDLTEALSEDDYTLLSEACKGASVGHLDDYLQSACRALCAPHCPATTTSEIKSFICGPPFVKSTELGPHILRDAKEVAAAESHWADQAGVCASAQAAPLKKAKN